MIAILGLLIILSLTLLVGRVAAVALTVTGLPREVARFQARSALTGVGFTTGESESIVGHPVRRRIVMQLMLIGSLNIVLTAGTLIRGLAAQGAGSLAQRLAVLVTGLFVLVWASRSRWLDRHLSGLIGLLVRRVAKVDTGDFASMLRLAGEYQVTELAVTPGDWLDGRTLAEADLPHEGVLVLGLVRASREYLGTPTGDTRLRAGDTLVLYGRTSAVSGLDRRRAGHEGDRSRLAAIDEQRRVVADEQRRDAEA